MKTVRRASPLWPRHPLVGTSVAIRRAPRAASRIVPGSLAGAAAACPTAAAVMVAVVASNRLFFLIAFFGDV